MTDTLTQHIAIVKREQNNGVTERADLIRAVREHHNACGEWWWTAIDCAKWVDLALAAIKLKEQNERKS